MRITKIELKNFRAFSMYRIKLTYIKRERTCWFMAKMGAESRRYI